MRELHKIQQPEQFTSKNFSEVCRTEEVGALGAEYAIPPALQQRFRQVYQYEGGISIRDEEGWV